ncbi:hypothetical protein EDB89DRAFT_1915249 [Lactarius sanguifluus]|nr:hypothetical protein EDB89DRAFT_1915249 [Lactarius sanguifluus]
MGLSNKLAPFPRSDRHKINGRRYGHWQEKQSLEQSSQSLRARPGTKEGMGPRAERGVTRDAWWLTVIFLAIAGKIAGGNVQRPWQHATATVLFDQLTSNECCCGLRKEGSA